MFDYRFTKTECPELYYEIERAYQRLFNDYNHGLISYDFIRQVVLKRFSSSRKRKSFYEWLNSDKCNYSPLLTSELKKILRG